ncbi:MAG: hypothetical protein A2Z34_07025 [Planctomycetes bacterium RBG_16_59_8]|nr:MAG: hypothetical protein A2Z34_07025 [Planctomycetes bacterium RBG_16_59_8]
MARSSALLAAIMLFSCAHVGTPPENDKTETEGVTLCSSDLWTGMTLRETAGGAAIDDFYFLSPAADAGLRKGDVVREAEGKTIRGVRDLLDALRGKRVGDSFAVTVDRVVETLSLRRNDKPVEKPGDPSGAIAEFVAKGKSGERLELSSTRKIDKIAASIVLAGLPSSVRILALPAAEAPSPKEEKKGAWIGVGMEDVKDLGEVGGTKGEKGLALTRIYENSPGQKAGLKLKDVIVAVNGERFPSAADSSPRLTFVEMLKGKKSGDSLLLSVLREEIAVDARIDDRTTPVEAGKLPSVLQGLNPGETMTARLAKVPRMQEIPVLLGERATALPQPTLSLEEIDALHPELASYKSDVERVAEKLMAATKTRSRYDDLIKRYVEDERWDDGFRLKEFRYLHCNPFKIPKISDDLATALRERTAAAEIDFPALFARAAGLLDEGEKTRVEPMPLKTGLSLADHAARMEVVLLAASRLRDEAFAGLPRADAEYLWQNLPGLAERLILDTHLSDPEEIKKRGDIDKRLLDLLRYVDERKLFLSARMLSTLLSPFYLETLEKDIAVAAASAKPGESVLFKKETALGDIVFGAAGNDRYIQNAAIIVDIGGDDFYTNRMGTSISLDKPFSIVIDFHGNDRYSSFENGSQGHGFMGVGMVADLEGNDIYIAQQWGQGSALAGVGLLYDRGGHDSYRGQEYVQGAAFFGIGIHIDTVGDDTYQANLYAQGFGLTKGFGLLADIAGDDVYYAAGKHPTGYEDNPGTFTGLSQGAGLGIRCYADWSMSRSGGIGFLLEGNGKDRYEAGIFAQGGGYFFGWGLLYDYGNENDDYIGTRYAQGFAAHSALGSFMDEGGDDRYRGLSQVHSGLSWDLTCVSFIDKGGNDIHEEGGFSRGATAHNGFIIYHDLGGADIYKDQVARSGDNGYHGGSSLTVFIDEGGGEDSYDDRENNSIVAQKEYSLFLDIPGRIGDLVDDETLPARLKNEIE